MHIFGALHELAHIELDMTWRQLDALVFQKTSEIMVHIRKDHVHGDGGVLAWSAEARSKLERESEGYELTSNNNHIDNVYDARVLESFEDFDFSEGSDWHPFFLVVHEDPLEGDDLSRGFLDCFVYFTG